MHNNVANVYVKFNYDRLRIDKASGNFRKTNKLWCEAQQTPPPCCDVAKAKNNNFISLHSHSLDGSTGLPEDNNQTK